MNSRKGIWGLGQEKGCHLIRCMYSVRNCAKTFIVAALGSAQEAVVALVLLSVVAGTAKRELMELSARCDSSGKPCASTLNNEALSAQQHCLGRIGPSPAAPAHQLVLWKHRWRRDGGGGDSGWLHERKPSAAQRSARISNLYLISCET